MTDKKVDEVLEEAIFLKAGRSMLVNGRYICTLKGEFSLWEDDPNSKSAFKTADVEIFDETDGTTSAGKFQIQIAPDLQDSMPYGTLAFIDEADKSKWRMHTVVSAQILEPKPNKYVPLNGSQSW